MQRLQDVLSGKENNYLVPLFWQHGEDEAVLRELMEKILESGIREVCLEARPHPDFCGPLWWRDVDIIMDQAKKTGMRVWIFDDSQFPTGWANGKAANAEKRLRKSHINYRVIDICGPRTGCSVLLSDQECENLISLTLCQKIENKNEMAPPFLNLTPKVKDGCCFFDVPEGLWRAVVVFEDDTCGAFRNYINMMNADSVQILVDEVYESHYARYKDEFGKTLAGFFTDEPGFYNVMSYEGKMGMPFPLPWTQGLLERLSQSLGEDAVPYLAGLWFDIGEATKKIRYCYMDTVSNLYKTCFCDKLGDWCRSHGVEYMGHIIEDNSAHARLADSCGHFFRALWGQDLSGIDVVLGQVLPGLDDENTKNMTGYGDGSFFHYGLAKLGSSLAHIDPKKKGRALCEIYGAYGWMEGLRLMKWLTDHMLVRGINYMMPHAFSPRPFPDPDCPPHFYARGENMQFPYMSYLFHYINRMCHLLNGGLHVPAAAVAYHAEAEWAGEATLFHKVGEQLMKRQLDYDVIPWDVLYEAEVQDKKLTINGESYPCLLVPYAQRLPQKAFDTLQRFCQAGLPVAFEGGLPQEAADGGTAPILPALTWCPLATRRRGRRAGAGRKLCFQPLGPNCGFTTIKTAGQIFICSLTSTRARLSPQWSLFPAARPAPVTTLLKTSYTRWKAKRTPFAYRLRLMKARCL